MLSQSTQQRFVLNALILEFAFQFSPQKVSRQIGHMFKKVFF
jgi:hypothetical protein